jgi:hypothetical protein
MANGGNLSKKMIKVKVVYLEQQYFELTKEMEIPFSVYKEYDKTGKVPSELVEQLTSETTIDHWVETNVISVRLNPITADKMATGGGVSNNDPQFIKYKDEEIMFVPERIYTHNWDDGDVLFMDQIVTLHCRPTKDCSKRLLHRMAFDFSKVPV